MTIHIITACDTTSKIGTKAAALKKRAEKYLQIFGEEGVDEDLVFKNTEKYLLELKSTTSSFDELRNYM